LSLAIFDLDNTLIAGDSDHGWGEFLIERGHVSAEEHKHRNDGFYQDYQNGTLDIREYLEFALAPLSRFDMSKLDELHSDFMREKIEPIILNKGLELIERHQQAGDTLLIITATNSFVTKAIAKRLGIDNILASEAEIKNGRYTGKPIGTPTFQEGKVERLNEWLGTAGESLKGSYFYSDSANDLPLLEQVDNPFAVDPDERLSQIAQARSWPIISLRR
jgi:HAD superfamily hydrolase (TIGR01490 family)